MRRLESAASTRKELSRTRPPRKYYGRQPDHASYVRRPGFGSALGCNKSVKSVDITGGPAEPARVPVASRIGTGRQPARGAQHLQAARRREHQAEVENLHLGKLV